MIPLRDAVMPQRFPWVTYILIGANLALFAYELSLGTYLDRFLSSYGWVPFGFSQTVMQGQIPSLEPLFVSMFLHGGWLHLIGNLFYLHLFGGNVEDRLGHLRYLGFYFLGGVIAVFAQTVVAPFSSTPMIGASGAIATVAGAYFVFSPTARVLTLIPLVVTSRIVQVPAVMYLLLWLALQLGCGFYALSPDGHELAGVAWWAHIGGFLAGVVLGPLLSRKRRRFQRLPLELPVVWNHPKSVLR